MTMLNESVNKQINEVLRLAGVEEKYILEEGVKDTVKKAALILGCIGATALGLSSTPAEAKDICEVVRVQEYDHESPSGDSFEIEKRNYQYSSEYRDGSAEHVKHKQNNNIDDIDGKQYVLTCDYNGKEYKVLVNDLNSRVDTVSYDNHNGENTSSHTKRTMDSRSITFMMDGKEKTISPKNAPKVFLWLDKNGIFPPDAGYVLDNKVEVGTNFNNDNGNYTKKFSEKGSSFTRNYADDDVVNRIYNDASGAIDKYNKK